MANVPWDGTGINCYGMGMGQIHTCPMDNPADIFAVMNSSALGDS